MLSKFCRLLFCEIVSVDKERSFISLRYSPRKLTHSIFVGCLGRKWQTLKQNERIAVFHFVSMALNVDYCKILVCK